MHARVGCMCRLHETETLDKNARIAGPSQLSVSWIQFRKDGMAECVWMHKWNKDFDLERYKCSVRKRWRKTFVEKEGSGWAGAALDMVAGYSLDELS